MPVATAGSSALALEAVPQMIIENVEEAKQALGILRSTLMQAGKVAGSGAVAGGGGSSLAHDIGSTSSTTTPQYIPRGCLFFISILTNTSLPFIQRGVLYLSLFLSSNISNCSGLYLSKNVIGTLLPLQSHKEYLQLYSLLLHHSCHI